MAMKMKIYQKKNEFYKDKGKVVYLGKETITQVESFWEYELKIKRKER